MLIEMIPANVAVRWEVEEPDAMSDEALAARSDAGSFTTLYRRHLRPVQHQESHRHRDD